MALLRVSEVVTAYGKIEALKGVSLEVAEGSITCLLGPNGAGKTTLMLTVAGLLRPKNGSIRFRDEEISSLPPHAVVSRGIALVPENRLVFPSMTVLENLHAGAYQRKDGKTHIFRLREHVDRLLDSCQICTMVCPYTREKLLQACIEVVRSNKMSSCYMRPLV